MIAYIKGVLEIKYNDSVVVETGGIGYKIFMPQNEIEKLGNIGDTVKVHTYYYVREDNISLYGFTSQEKLRMFELLIQTSGIGAKSATTILANIEPHTFALAVVTNDDARLTKIPGIGKKTAARMILELKDKMKVELDGQEISNSVAIENHYSENVEEAISALQVLGYTKRDIEKALEKQELNSLSVEEIIRKGLTLLSRD